MVQTIAGTNVTSIVDLGAGGGTLSDAAARHWSNLSVTTVDVDTNCEVAKRFRAGAKNHSHYTLDALDPDIVLKVAEAGLFDAAVCNPPFKRLVWHESYDRVLAEAGLDQCLSRNNSELAAEALFLAQNIRLVRPGGSVGLVVSDSFISGKAAAPLRNKLVQRHSIRAVVQLPRRAFSGTEANSFLLAFKNKVMSSEKISLFKYTMEGGLSEAVTIDRDAAERRLDFDFHSLPKESCDLPTLSSLGALITRGSISTTEVRTAPDFVFHTSDFSRWENGEVYAPSTEHPKVKVGDILIARVDRNLEYKVVIVREGAFRVSDCVFVVRLPPEHQNHVFKALRSDAGRRKLKSISRGVGARHISKGELLNYKISEM
ncbi:N-6 DNA methylase [Agrobacterium sp. CMT1]|uniref:N-6 DNA methylase n=1 Tax=Agrobacterium sp. CMT1 TaxID=3128901 RepID=UPI003076DB2B